MDYLQQEINRISEKAERIRQSDYRLLAITLIETVQYYCAPDSHQTLPDEIYEFVESGKYSDLPIVARLHSSDIRHEVVYLAEIVMDYECKCAWAELDDETEALNNEIWNCLYA